MIAASIADLSRLLLIDRVLFGDALGDLSTLVPGSPVSFRLINCSMTSNSAPATLVLPYFVM